LWNGQNIERQLLIRGRAFAAFYTTEKALAGRKKSFRGPHFVKAYLYGYFIETATDIDMLLQV